MNTVEPQSISDFLGNSKTKKLIIPLFQRPYSWGEVEINDFKSDVSSLPPIFKGGNSNSDLFLGLIVLCPSDEIDQAYQIIDGQQRITTILIFLSIIHDLLKDYAAHPDITSDSKFYGEINRTVWDIRRCIYFGQTDDLLLETDNEDLYESDFLKILLHEITVQPDPFFSLNYDLQVPKSKSSYNLKRQFLLDKKNFPLQKKAKDKNSLKNSGLLYDFLQIHLDPLDRIKEKATFLRDLTYSFLNKTNVIPFLSKSQERAFSLFETLNDRGLEVAAIDLIKNLCIMHVEKGQRVEVYGLWKKIFTEILNKKDGTVFLRYSFNSRTKFGTKAQLYKNFYERIKELSSVGGGNAVINELKTLESFAKNYDVLKNVDSMHENNGINNVIHLLRDTNSIQWISMGLSLLRVWDNYCENNSDRKILEPLIIGLFEDVHKLVFGIIVKGQRFNLIEQFVPSYCR